MKTKLISFVFLLVLLLATPHKTFAAELASGSSANFASLVTTTQSYDTRRLALRAYLMSYHSPLAQYADYYVAMADKYGLPWNLVPAITGTESTFGQQAPANCNNFYGYGIYGSNVLCFTSVEAGIETVSKALREQYVNTWGATTVDEIGHLYAASPTWSAHTTFFMKQMETFKVSFDAQALPISL
jgi:hypothetical protein